MQMRPAASDLDREIVEMKRAVARRVLSRQGVSLNRSWSPSVDTRFEELTLTRIPIKVVDEISLKARMVRIWRRARPLMDAITSGVHWLHMRLRRIEFK